MSATTGVAVNGHGRWRDDMARHGADAPRGQAAPADGGRYGRMFGCLPPAAVGETALEQLAAVMTRAAGSSLDNPEIPAGYTYLAQFVDHDITYEPTSRLGRDNDPRTLPNFRTPRLDLDSLYGAGPLAHPFLYDWETERPECRGAQLLVGRNRGKRLAAQDLPRNAQARALIGDARNDENAIVSQLHLLFIRFHNKVVEREAERRTDLDGVRLFEHAQRVVRWHYQSVVMHDLLPRLVGTEVAHSVLSPRNGRPPTVTREFYRWRGRPFMPVEFSGAAYRFGHSMVREDYHLNETSGGVPVFRVRPPSKAHLVGTRALPADLEINWAEFFELSATPPQYSRRIDTKISVELAHLPRSRASLPLLNLRRGLALGLPSGPDVARAMGIDPLDEELVRAALAEIPEPGRTTLVHELPLWYYVLLEAELLGREGLQLGPVGGRIVAEVLIGLLEADPDSYLRRYPRWEPDLPKAGETFKMPDLVRFALGEAVSPAP